MTTVRAGVVRPSSPVSVPQNTEPSEGSSRGRNESAEAASQASLLERRQRDLQAAEAELQATLRVSAQADQCLREAERTLRDAWEVAARSAGTGVAELDQVAELRVRRAALAQARQASHRAADAAARRVAATRLAVEAVDATARRLHAAIAQQETTVASLRRGIAIAEQRLAGRRETVQAEERVLQDFRRKLLDLAGS